MAQHGTLDNYVGKRDGFLKAQFTSLTRGILSPCWCKHTFLEHAGLTMKPLRLVFCALLIGWVSALPTSSQAGMKARLADKAWDGETIPEGQQCSHQGGNGSTPALEISGIPPSTNEIAVAFNDESFPLMNHGGHGVLAFAIDNVGVVTLPPIPGETNDLPEGVRSLVPHQATKKRYSPGTAYLPPCSGGLGNKYSITITALKLLENGRARVLDKVWIPLGQY